MTDFSLGSSRKRRAPLGIARYVSNLILSESPVIRTQFSWRRVVFRIGADAPLSRRRRCQQLLCSWMGVSANAMPRSNRNPHNLEGIGGGQVRHTGLGGRSERTCPL